MRHIVVDLCRVGLALCQDIFDVFDVAARAFFDENDAQDDERDITGIGQSGEPIVQAEALDQEHSRIVTETQDDCDEADNDEYPNDGRLIAGLLEILFGDA